MQVVRVRIDKALDFFGGDDASALFVFEYKDNAAVAFLQFAKLLLEGEEQILVEPPIQECANAVDFLDCEYRKFAHLRKRLVERCNRAVFGVRVNEYVNDFAFDKCEFVAVAGEEHASASFEFQVITLRCNGFNACAVNSSKFHNLPFRSGIPRGGGNVADIRDTLMSCPPPSGYLL